MPAYRRALGGFYFRGRALNETVAPASPHRRGLPFALLGVSSSPQGASSNHLYFNPPFRRARPPVFANGLSLRRLTAPHLGGLGGFTPLPI